jgi:phosphotransferase system enzyme I (PtsI)
MPDVRPKEEYSVQGISASQGIAYGQIFLYIQTEIEVPVYHVNPEKRMEEIGRFEVALLATRQQIQQIQAQVEKNLGPDEARIFDAHLMVLEDQALIAETFREFELNGHNIETCFNTVSRRYIKAFDEIDDEYLRERGGDLRDVAQRVLHNLLGRTGGGQKLSELVDKRIVVANDISPSDAAGIDRSQAFGIVTDTGSKTSHAVIVARSMKIPAVVGVRDLTKRLRNGDWVIVDGYDGVVIVNPSEQTLFRYGKIRLQKKSFEQRLMEAVRLPAITQDGTTVPLRANIEHAEETALVTSYRDTVAALAPAPVVIRTLDLGGDKPMVGAPGLFPQEQNPFLGFRAIRFCLEHLDLFKTQLRAILRASAHGKVLLMYPMISGREELGRANAVLATCKAELMAEGQPFDPDLAVGSMIEIPSAAVTADLLARECDFFSIGTNDLIQYLLAIDRVNDRIAHLYEPTHPAVLRTLKHVVDEAHKAGIKVSVCGEMAGDPVYTALLLGLGVDELSMTPPSLPAVKYLVRALTMAEARALAAQALALDAPKEIYALCDAFCSARLKPQ